LSSPDAVHPVTEHADTARQDRSFGVLRAVEPLDVSEFESFEAAAEVESFLAAVDPIAVRSARPDAIRAAADERDADAFAEPFVAAIRESSRPPSRAAEPEPEPEPARRAARTVDSDPPVGLPYGLTVARMWPPLDGVVAELGGADAPAPVEQRQTRATV